MHRRGTRVICRTKRGLEVGFVLAVLDNESNVRFESQQDDDTALGGSIIRRATAEDHLLSARLEKNRLAALQECERILANHPSSSGDFVLVDIELLFDGQTIFFYFLGDNPSKPSPKLESLLQELAAAYEAKVELRRFAETLASGCGPDCGTGEGCGDGEVCTGCALAASCRN